MKSLEKLEKDLNFCHVDMDAFYASLEMQRHPHLKGQPMVVGGKSKKGIITTANYEARKFGLHSAMPIFMAKSLCPQVIVIPTDMDYYRRKSREIFHILEGFTDNIEKVSVDEAYLDISNIADSRELIALNIQEEVFKQTGLTLSVGISYNKFLAKLASDWHKPSGIKIINRQMVPDILLSLDISKVHGIGQKTENRLNKIGIYTVKDLYQLDRSYLRDNFGKSGSEIYDRIRGLDDRKIEDDIERKSIGIERTLDKNINSIEELLKIINYFARDLSNDLKSKNVLAKRFTVKLKRADFQVRTKSYTLAEYTDSLKTIEDLAKTLLLGMYNNEEIRLVGLTAFDLQDNSIKQENFFEILK